MKQLQRRKCLLISLLIIFITVPIIPTGLSSSLEQKLPPPLPVHISLELAISQRMSVRNLTDQPITDQQLSTILWAAYGLTHDENRTVLQFNHTYAARIYVLNNEGAYRYNPFNHSLELYKLGNYSVIGQYTAPIHLGIVWDSNIDKEENLTCAQIGAMGQNIQFMANALNLGTVVTAGNSTELQAIGLPPGEIAKLIMPIGYPEQPYHFIYRPLRVSLLPQIQFSTTTLTKALNDTSQEKTFSGSLTSQEKSQILWATYGYSPYFDNSAQVKNPVKRHRTVPSAHGYYPLRFYMITSTGVYRYIPGIYDPIYGLLHGLWNAPMMTFLWNVNNGDHRNEIAQACNQDIDDAPAILVSVVDREKNIRYDDLSGNESLWLWSYEAGAAAQNVLLESVAWNLSANVLPISNLTLVRSIVKVNDRFTPLLVIPIGKKS